MIIIGDSGVGKTSLLEAFHYRKISKSAKPTIGAEFTKRKVTLESGAEVSLQIWDTAGQERFQSLCTSFYRGTDCCVLVFDLSAPESYENLDSWRVLFQQTTGDEAQDIPIILVGNKSAKQHQIDPELVKQEWVDTKKCRMYIQASALKLHNIDGLFLKVGQLGFDFYSSQKLGTMSHTMINVQNLRKKKDATGAALELNTPNKTPIKKLSMISNRNSRDQCAC